MKKLFSYLTLFLIFFSLTPFVLADETDVSNYSVETLKSEDYDFEAGMAIDQRNGQILFEKNVDTQHGIASLTKLISLGVVYQALDEGRLHLKDKVPISKRVAELSTEEGLSNVPLKESTDRYTVDQLIDASIVSSANAAVVALGEKLDGSESAFVREMGKFLKQWDIHDYTLYTASGLDSRYLTDGSETIKASEKENTMSPRELLFYAKKLVQKYPDIQRRSQIPKETLTDSKGDHLLLVTQNKFIKEDSPYLRSDVVGLKTGTEREAGACILVQTYSNGRPIMVLTLGAPSDDERYLNTSRLINSLQQNYVFVTLHREGESVTGDKPVKVQLGVIENTMLHYNEQTGALVPRGYFQNHDWTYDYEKPVAYTSNGQLQVKAPIKENEAVNTEYASTPFFSSIDEGEWVSSNWMGEQAIPEVSFSMRIARLITDLLEGRLFRMN